MPAPATATRLLPKEHGTWAMLLVPWAVGWGVGGSATLRQILLLVAAVSLFLAHAQLLAWYRRRAAARPDLWAAAAARRLLLILTALGLAAAVPLMVAMPLARLMPLVGIGALAAALTGASLGLVTRRLDHALPGQMLAAVGLGAFSPLALAAFIPAALQTTAGIARLDRPASLKRVGILLTAHSIVFGLAVICL